MKLRQLRRTHPDYNPEMLRAHADLFAGGAQFAKNVRHYLPQNDVEPKAVYDRRCKAAHFVGYVAPIVNYFASWLFTCPPKIESDPEEVPSFYAALKEDCDGRGTDLDQFLRARFVEAAITKRAFWRIEFPEGEPTPNRVRADWEEGGLGRATLRAIPAASIINWRRSPDGALIWILEHERRDELLAIGDDEPTITETWTLWREDGSAERWQIAYPKSKPPGLDDLVTPLDSPVSPVSAIPIVELCLPDELWIVNHLASGQLEHFRKANALSWSIDRTCYAMPVFKLKDRRNPPKMGAGYYLMLGVDESVEWPAPPATPFATIQEYNAKLRDELHRVAHQMAVAVDNNAAAVGRSGESKDADNRATEIVLSAYGRLVTEAVERTFDMVARGRDEEIAWSIGGMDSYRLPDAKATGDAAIVADTLQIPSATFRRELFKRVAAAYLPDIDEATRKEIAEEIDAGVSDEDVLPAPEPSTDSTDPDPHDPVRDREPTESAREARGPMNGAARA